MKILLLADLHGKQAWYDWALLQKVDAICAAGDLMDAFAEEGLMPQVVDIARWSAQSPVPLVLSGGNHDEWLADAEPPDPSLDVPRRLFTSERWMDALECPAGLVPDGRSEIVRTAGGAFVATTVPFDFSAEEPCEDLWLAGAKLRVTHRLPWIVLHHEPPCGSEVGGLMGHAGLDDLIERFRPQFVLSGHLHHQPYVGNFVDRVHDTWCFNPGAPPKEQISGAEIPNHILLDLAARKATWSATPERGSRLIRKTLSLG